MLLNLIYQKIKLKVEFSLKKVIWRKHNKHNHTFMGNNFLFDKVSVGNYTYGKLYVYSFSNEKESLNIGNYCCIANDVKFILGGEHHPSYISNFPFKKYLGLNDTEDRGTKGPIIVGDDVWIGMNSIILSGVTIGQGAVVAAGSVISKDIPPYAICTTNKIIKYRFDKDIIENLLKIDYAQLNLDHIRDNLDLFYEKVDDKTVEKLRKIEHYKN